MSSSQQRHQIRKHTSSVGNDKQPDIGLRIGIFSHLPSSPFYLLLPYFFLYLLNLLCSFVLRPFNPVSLYFYFPLLHYLPLSIKVYHFPICWNISAFLPVVPYPSFHFSLCLSISSSRVPSHHASFLRVLRSTEKIGRTVTSHSEMAN